MNGFGTCICRALIKFLTRNLAAVVHSETGVSNAGTLGSTKRKVLNGKVSYGFPHVPIGKMRIKWLRASFGGMPKLIQADVTITSSIPETLDTAKNPFITLTRLKIP